MGMCIHLQRIISVQVSVQQLIAPIAAFLSSGQLVKYGTELMGDILQPVFGDLMRNHQMSLDVATMAPAPDKPNSALPAYSTAQCPPISVEVPCQHGHRDSLQGIAWKHVAQEANHFLRCVRPWYHHLPSIRGCNQCQLCQTNAFVMQFSPAR